MTQSEGPGRRGLLCPQATSPTQGLLGEGGAQAECAGKGNDSRSLSGREGLRPRGCRHSQ